MSIRWTPVCAIPVIVVLFSGVCAAQYYAPKWQRLPIGRANELGASRYLISQATTDTMSSWRELPFTWVFGNCPVTGFRASTTGIVVFDSVPVPLQTDNTALPNLQLPANSMCVFWDRFIGARPGTPRISIRYGSKFDETTMQRIYTIYWDVIVFSVPFTTVIERFAFCVVLYEDGSFKFVYLEGIHDDALGGTIGYQTFDKHNAFQIAGSPALDFPEGAYQPDSNLVLCFEPRQRRCDAALVSALFPSVVSVSDSVGIPCAISNKGADTIRGFDLCFAADSKLLLRESIQNIALAPDDSIHVTFAQQYLADTPGRDYTFRLWIERVQTGESGVRDQHGLNDTLQSKAFSVLGVSVQRRLLIETFTANWCGHCPNGHWELQKVDSLFKNISFISHHPSWNDTMVSYISYNIHQLLGSGVPTSMFDRINPDQYFTPALDPSSDWISRAAGRLAIPSPVKLSAYLEYNPSNRTITIFCEHQFVDYVPRADYRLNVFVVEDHIMKPDSAYRQYNLQYNGPPDNPYRSWPEYIYSYDHRNVLRDAATGTWGISLPAETTIGNSYRHQFTYSIPAEFNDQEIKVVAFIARYDSIRDNHEVLNTAEARVFPVTSIAVPSATAISIGDPVPNPAQNRSWIDISLPARQHIAMELFSTLGNRIATVYDAFAEEGNSRIPIDLHSLRPGFYLLSIRGSNWHEVRKISVIR